MWGHLGYWHYFGEMLTRMAFRLNSSIGWSWIACWLGSASYFCSFSNHKVQAKAIRKVYDGDFMVVDTVSIAVAVKRQYIQSPTLCCPCHKVNRLSGCSRCPFPLDLSLHLPEPCKTVGPVVLWELSLLCVIWPAEGRKPTQTVNNERLLAFETEQAKRNTKHSSERTVITHKPVSALLEGLLLCVNDLSCLWRSALWLRLWLLKSCNHVAEGNKDVIYGWVHNRWPSKMTLSPSYKSIVCALFTFCTFGPFIHVAKRTTSMKPNPCVKQNRFSTDRLPDFSISFCCDSQ